MTNIPCLVGQSIMLELETVLSVICGCYPKRMAPQYAAVIQQIPHEFITEIQMLLDKNQEIFSFLEFASVLADVLFESNYEQASLAIRSLTAEAAVRSYSQKMGFLNLKSSDEADKLVDLIVECQLALYTALGKTLSNPHKMEAKLKADALLTKRILKGGDLHSHFWLVLDRLYYQYWLPFRNLQADKMRLAETTLYQAFDEGDIYKALDWLPSQHPLRLQPHVVENIQKLGLKLFFWSEPIGLPDSWFVTPEVFGVSFAEPSEVLETLRTFAETITQRTAALSDPTRLIILRLIREFGKNNTEIASFLGISRPTVSNHVKILREAGLITSRQENGSMIHQLQEPELASLFADLKKFLAIS